MIEQLFPNTTDEIKFALLKRWAYYDKSFRLNKKTIDDEKVLAKAIEIDKQKHDAQVKRNMLPFETLFFELGAEILSTLSDFIAANPDKAAQKIRKDLAKAIKQVKTSKDPKVINTLKTQLDRLKAIGGLKAVVPTEGITFVFKGKLYKYTGAFAPANQILGLLKFV